MTQKYPDESVQGLVAPDPAWWLADQPLGEGSLVWGLAPFPAQKPQRLIPIGRGKEERQHSSAAFRLEEFRVGDRPPKTSTLPVAAMPVRVDESHMVLRGKRRPVLILAEAKVRIDPSLTRGKRRWQTARTRLVAPFYSANGTSLRGGWLPELVTRIQHCEYPQYFWDALPVPSSTEGSILRFDHAFSIGEDVANIEPTGYQLHSDALGVLQDWYLWYVTGTVPRDSVLETVLSVLRDLDASS